MIIEKIVIKSFGLLTDMTLEFSDGVNVIEGRNESGKSTIAAFIRYMLYGFDNTEPDDLPSERRKRINWDTGVAAGSMYVRVKGKRYLITRTTTPTDTDSARPTYREDASIVDLETGSPAFGKMPAGEVFFGVDRELFDNTAFIGQINDAGINEGKVKEAIENILFSGNERINTQRATNKISDKMGMEFATASLHNSFYFVEAKNIIKDRPMVAKNFEKLVNELLKSNSPKKWFRAYFNHGLINYIYGQKRLLPCDMSFDTFFIDPYGDVMPCNGTKDKEVMGNLNTQSWDELWNSPEAEKVRKKVRACNRNCWMIGSVSPAMHKYIMTPALWVVRHKLKSIFGIKYSMYENPICKDYRDGKISKEELDKNSTCDMNAVINNGLSESSKEALAGKRGEDIVNADVVQQGYEATVKS